MDINKLDNTLTQFTQRYVDLWQKTFNHEPKSTELYGISSPCITMTNDKAVFWLPVMATHFSLNIVEQVMNITLHTDAHLYYETQYAGDMSAQWDNLTLTLIQVWNDEDFSRLEQNLIAHLTMQKKLKRQPSIFIGTTDDATKIITIDNLTGKIILDNLVENQLHILANDLNSFLSQLKPIAQ